MKVLRGTSLPAFLNQSAAVAIGNFDGVHLGHQALLKQLKQEAEQRNIPAVVILFEPQPCEFFNPQQAPVRLSSLREKLYCMAHMGIDLVWCIPFNERLAGLEAQKFIQDILINTLAIAYLVVGKDFRFGRQRQGDVSLLAEFAESQGCELAIFSDHVHLGERISSTRIRKALADNQLEQAAMLLGRPYSMIARVVHGHGQAGKWGIPTANLHMNRHSVPIHGVFCVQVERKNGRRYAGVANLGVRPTINGRRLVLEVHLFDFQETIYGEILQVFFLHKLRDEVKFSSIDDLVVQIHQDVACARQYFEKQSQVIQSIERAE